MKPGITSYKHLNKVLIQILKKTGKPMTSRGIDDYIFNHYKTNKLHVNAITIGKRLQFLPHVEKIRKRKGVYLYQYSP